MKKIIGAVLILAGLALGFFVIPSITPDTPEQILDKLQQGDDKAVTEKLATITETSVIEYDYTNAVTFGDKEKLMKKVDIPFTAKNIVMTYDGVIKIGADTSKLEAVVEKDAAGAIQTVTITLPEVDITSNEIDRDSIQFPVEKATILNKIKYEDYDYIEKTAKTEIEKSVKASKVMDDAETELRKSLTGFLQGLYGKDINVEFKAQ